MDGFRKKQKNGEDVFFMGRCWDSGLSDLGLGLLWGFSTGKKTVLGHAGLLSTRNTTEFRGVRWT